MCNLFQFLTFFFNKKIFIQQHFFLPFFIMFIATSVLSYGICLICVIYSYMCICVIYSYICFCVIYSYFFLINFLYKIDIYYCYSTKQNMKLKKNIIKVDVRVLDVGVCITSRAFYVTTKVCIRLIITKSSFLINVMFITFILH